MSQAQKDVIAESFRRLYAGWGAGTTIGRMREEWDGFLSHPRVDAQVTPVDADGVPCRWVQAVGASADRVIVYFHGGGYQIGSPASHHNAMTMLSAQADCRVLGVAYRLAPEHRFPAPVDDALAAWRWLMLQGVDSSQVGLCGDSAGAGLAVALLTVLRDQHMPLPAAAVAMSPWVDMEALGSSFVDNAERDPVTRRDTLLLMARTYLGRGGDPRTPLASPIHADLSRLPPLLVQAGSDEVLLDDARQLVLRAQEYGTDARLSLWPGMFHTFQLFTGRLREADTALAEAAVFLHAAMINKPRKQT